MFVCCQAFQIEFDTTLLPDPHPVAVQSLSSHVQAAGALHYFPAGSPETETINQYFHSLHKDYDGLYWVIIIIIYKL